MKRSFLVVLISCLFGIGCSITIQMPGAGKSNDQESISKKTVPDDSKPVEKESAKERK